MKIKFIIVLILVLTACSSKNNTADINPLAVQALAGCSDYTVEIMLEEM